MNKRVEVIAGVYPNQISLDLEANAVSIALQYSIDDVRNIDKKNTNYSKTITLPGTKKNNLAFGGLFDVNSTFDQFNPNLKTTARIVVDSSPVLEGYLQLKSVKKLNNADLQGNKISYEVIVFDDSVDFMQSIGDKLVSQLDFSDKNHTYNQTNIEDAWSNNTYADVYQYPLMDKKSSDYPYITTDFKPCFYHKALLLKIAEKAGDQYEEDGTLIPGEGYTLEGSFIDDQDEYEKEVIGWDGSTPKIPNSEARVREFKTGLTTAQTTLDTGIKTNANWSYLGIKSPVNYDDTSDPNGFYDNTGNYATSQTIDGKTGATYTAPKTGKYNFNVTQNFEIDYTCSSVSTMTDISSGDAISDPIIRIGARLRYEDTGEQLAGATYTVNFGRFTDFSSSGTQVVGPEDRSFIFSNIRVEKDRPIYIEYDLGCERNFAWYNLSILAPVTIDFKINNTLESGALSFWINQTVLEQNIEDGDEVEINQYLPSTIKQKDIISDLIKRYNLYIIKHPVKPKTLILQTRDKYYKNNITVLDWTQKKDYSSEDSIKFLSDLQNKEILFTYKEDNGAMAADGLKYAEAYTKSTGDLYGQKKISFKNDFVSGVKEIKSVFSTSLLIDRGSVVVPSVNSSEGKRNPVLLYWGGLIPAQDKDGILKDIQVKYGDDSATTYTNYPYAGHYNNPFSPSYDLHYGKVTAEYYNIFTKSIPNNNLFNNHWRNYYNQIKEGKLITSKLYLKETDINFIKDNLNARIFIKDSYYNINKITDYKPLEDGLTTVELLRIEQGSEFTYDNEEFEGPFLTSSDVDYTGTSNSAGPFMSSVTNEVDSSNVMALGVRNYVGSGSSGIINGNDNVIGGNSTGVNITGDNNTVGAGVSNVTIVGDNQTVNESDTSVINGNVINTETTGRVYKELEIGGWDWSVSYSKSVNHDLSATEWKTITNTDITIINDDDDDYKPMSTFGLVSLNSTSFDLLVGSSNTDYDDDTVNRGYIRFYYVAD